jgi:exodeoxyribonuclease VII small subunit
MSDANNLNGPRFEDAYRELGEILDKLESGDLTLDDSVALYERGRLLVELCAKMLDSAELRISRLTGDDEGNKIEPLA